MAKITDLDFSINQNESQLSAIQLFTDREEPQEAFERKLSVIRQYQSKTSGVLCYYGIGGIGKTSLMNKLCHLLSGDQECGPSEIHSGVIVFIYIIIICRHLDQLIVNL